MKRPLAVLAAVALTSLAGLVPAVPASADDTPAPTPSAIAPGSPTPDPTSMPPRQVPWLPDPLPMPNPVIPKTTVRWVNGTLTVLFSSAGPFYQGQAEGPTYLIVDGKYIASSWDPEYHSEDAAVSVYPVRDHGVEASVVVIPRAASDGPARIEFKTFDAIEVQSGHDSTYVTTWYTATVQQKVVKPKKGQASAWTLLDHLKVAKESHASTFKRSKFKLWVDANHDGESTRAEVLKAESKKKVTENSRHTVKTGKWTSAYDGATFTGGSKLDIDQLVPLQEAWTSGASSWSTKKRTAYANDIGYSPSLIAVSKHANRSKGDKEPNGYLPTQASYRCAYVRNYIAVKSRWRLQVDTTEQKALKTDLAAYCANPYVAKPGKPNLTALAGSAN
jgi:hypothetical protein